MKKLNLLFACAVIASLFFMGCKIGSGDDTHTHTFDTKWSKNATEHWHAATCEHTTEKADAAAHTFGKYASNNDATTEADGTKSRTCSVCGYVDTVTDEGSKLPPPAPDYSKTFSDVKTVEGKSMIMGKCEVTREWYKEITKEDDPSAAYPCTASDGDKRPVDNIDKAKAVDFCNKLSAKEGLVPYYDSDGNASSATGAEYGYRLPTKAEWEAFAWAGTTNTYAIKEIPEGKSLLPTNGNDASYKVFTGEPIATETSTDGTKTIPVYDDNVETRDVVQDDLQSWVNPFVSGIANIGDPILAEYAWTKYNVYNGSVDGPVPQPLSSVKASAWEVFKYNGKYYKTNAYGWAAIRGDKDDSLFGTRAVATKNPNAWDLYDMTGNVSELVEDLTYGVGGDVASNTSKISIGYYDSKNDIYYDSKILGFRVCRTVNE